MNLRNMKELNSYIGNFNYAFLNFDSYYSNNSLYSILTKNSK